MVGVGWGWAVEVGEGHCTENSKGDGSPGLSALPLASPGLG